MGYAAAKDDMKGCETQRRRFLLSLKFSTRGTAICIVIPKWNLAAVEEGKWNSCPNLAIVAHKDAPWRREEDRAGEGRSDSDAV